MSYGQGDVTQVFLWVMLDYIQYNYYQTLSLICYLSLVCFNVLTSAYEQVKKLSPNKFLYDFEYLLCRWAMENFYTWKWVTTQKSLGTPDRKESFSKRTFLGEKVTSPTNIFKALTKATVEKHESEIWIRYHVYYKKKHNTIHMYR